MRAASIFFVNFWAGCDGCNSNTTHSTSSTGSGGGDLSGVADGGGPVQVGDLYITPSTAMFKITFGGLAAT